jgi:hypothetical protein
MAMPFQNKTLLINKNSNKEIISLQTLQIISTPNDKKNIYSERVSPFISFHASLTIEAALVLPIFIFAICFMMYFTEIVRVQAEIGNELYKQSKNLSIYAYVYDRAQSNGIIASGKIEDLVSGALSNLYVKSKIKQELGDDYLDNNNIKSGISLILSSYMQEEDVIDILAIYKISIPCNFFQLNKIPVFQRARIRAWTGYESTKNTKEQEEMVYITQNGTVYHKDPSCTHIHLSITEVSSSHVKDHRNSDGGKYYECELCGEEPNNGTVYITDTGDRYHNSRECSGLKRGVMAVPISQVGGRSPCSRCGNEN